MTAPSFTRRVLREVQVYGATTRRSRRNVRLLLVSVIFLGTGLQVFFLLYNLYLLELGFTLTFLGQVAATSSLGMMVGGIPGGMLYSRRGGRVSFTVGILSMALLWSVQLLVRTPLLILAASFFGGIAMAFHFTATFPFLADESSDKDRTYLFSINSIVWTFAEVAGNLIGGMLPAGFLSLLALSTLAEAQRVSMFAGTAFALLALIPVFAIQPGQREPTVVEQPVAPTQRPSRTALRGFIGGAVVVFFVGLTTGATFPFYNVYFSQFHQATTEQVGIILSLSRAASLVGLFILPALSNQMGKVKAGILLSFITVVFFIPLGLPLSLWLAVPIFLVGYSCFIANFILCLNLIMEVVSPRQRGTQGSIRMFTEMFGRAAAGVVAGNLIARSGYGGLFTLGAVFTVGIAVALWAFFRHSPAAAPGSNTA